MSAEISSRSKQLLLLSLFFVVVALGAGIWWFKVLYGSETTDDAYVAGNVVPVMPQVAGNVITLHVEDTQLVKAGMPLVEMDPTDAKLALLRAETQLAQTLRQVQQQMASSNSSMPRSRCVRRSWIGLLVTSIAARFWE